MGVKSCGKKLFIKLLDIAQNWALENVIVE